MRKVQDGGTRWGYKMGIQDGGTRWGYKMGVQDGGTKWGYKMDKDNQEGQAQSRVHEEGRKSV